MLKIPDDVLLKEKIAKKSDGKCFIILKTQKKYLNFFKEKIYQIFFADNCLKFESWWLKFCLLAATSFNFQQLNRSDVAKPEF